MSSLGESLRKARLQQAVDVITIAGQLRLNPKYLEAIERDDLSGIPGRFFYRSFVHQYAQSLNFDLTPYEDELSRLVGALPQPPLPGENGAPIPVREAPYPESSFRRKAVLAGLALATGFVLLGSGIYYWWSDLGKLGSAVVARAGALLDRGSHPAPAVVAAAPPLSKAEPIEPSKVTPPPTPPPSSAVTQAVPVSLATQTQPTTAVAPSPGSLMLRLTASAPVWVSLWADGKAVFAGVMEPAQTQMIDGKKSAKLTVGNASGLSVEFNGKPIGALGRPGEVKIVVFTPDKFEFVQTAPPPPPTTGL